MIIGGEKFTIRELTAMGICVLTLKTDKSNPEIIEDSVRNRRWIGIAGLFVGGRKKCDLLAVRFAKALWLENGGTLESWDECRSSMNQKYGTNC